MIRVKDPKKTIPFYEKLGLTMVCEKHFSDFSLFFLANLPPGVKPPSDTKSKENDEFVKTLFCESIS